MNLTPQGLKFCERLTNVLYSSDIPAGERTKCSPFQALLANLHGKNSADSRWSKRTIPETGATGSGDLLDVFIVTPPFLHIYLLAARAFSLSLSLSRTPVTFKFLSETVKLLHCDRSYRLPRDYCEYRAGEGKELKDLRKLQLVLI